MNTLFDKTTNHQNRKEVISVLVLLMLTPVTQSFLSKLVPQHNNFMFQSADEIALLCLFWVALRGFRVLLLNKLWLGVLVFYSVYLLFSYISAILRDIPFGIASQQAMISFKYVYVLAVLIGVRNGIYLVRLYMAICKPILILSIILITWQFIKPEFYDAIFTAGYHKAFLSANSDVRIARGVGVFSHPGQMAMFSGSYLILLVFLGRDFVHTTRIGYLIWIIISFVALALTFSRLEIVATITAIMFVSMLYIKQRKNTYRFLTLGTAIAITGLAIYPVIGFYLDYYIGSDIVESTDPRVVLMLKGIELAISYFPLGSGFGTYGGYIAYTTDSTLYQDLGFNAYSWFQDRRYLTDTFWAHILGESGIFGFLSLVTSLILVAWIAYRYSVREPLFTPVSQAVVAGIGLLVLNSFTTPDLVSVLSLSQCLLAISIFFNAKEPGSVKIV